MGQELHRTEEKPEIEYEKWLLPKTHLQTPAKDARRGEVDEGFEEVFGQEVYQKGQKVQIRVEQATLQVNH